MYYCGWSNVKWNKGLNKQYIGHHNVFKDIIYSHGKQSSKNRKSFICWFGLQIRPGWSQELGIPRKSPTRMIELKDLKAPLLPPRCICMELNEKWSSHDWNWHSERGYKSPKHQHNPPYHNMGPKLLKNWSRRSWELNRGEKGQVEWKGG